MVLNSLSRVSHPLTAIVAMGRNNEIGFKGDMPWHIPEDLRHFKQLTIGNPVIMGRATWNSLPRKPLPGRLNIIITRHPENENEVSSIHEAVEMCPPDSNPFIIGGGQIYKAAFPLLDRIEVTRIEADFPEADTFFPDIDLDDWILIEESQPVTSVSGLCFRYQTYERRNNQ